MNYVERRFVVVVVRSFSGCSIGSCSCSCSSCYLEDIIGSICYQQPVTVLVQLVEELEELCCEKVHSCSCSTWVLYY